MHLTAYINIYDYRT